jgi:hypothetical protein
MMRLVLGFVDHAEAAVAAGVHPERLAAMATLRAVQRMGEEIGDGALEHFAALESRIDGEFAALVGATNPTPGEPPAPPAPTPGSASGGAAAEEDRHAPDR